MKALLLGAGASYELGLQLVWELTGELKNWLTSGKLNQINEGWLAQGYGYSDETISLIKNLLDVDSMHYENLIGALEVEMNREQNRDRYQELHGIRIWLLEIIYHLLYNRQVNNSAYIETTIKDLYGIKKLAEEAKPLWVFSLNHDINLEIIAAEYGIPVKSGFNEIVTLPARSKEGIVVGNIEFEYLSRKNIESNNYDFFNTGEYGINLVKMHGSLDIFGQEAEINNKLNYLKIKPKNLNCAGYTTELEKVNTQLHHPLGKPTNEIAYADEEGEMQFLRYSLLSGAHKFTGKIEQIAPPEFLGLFKSYANIADEIICIGYGFGDRHINDIIDNWLSISNEKNIEIINPNINNVPASLAHLSLQISIKNIGYIDYFLSLDSSKDSPLNLLERTDRSFQRDKVRQWIKINENKCKPHAASGRKEDAIQNP